MSSSTTTPTSSEKGGWKKTVLLIAFGLAMYLAWREYGAPYFFPPREAGARLVDNLCGDHEVAKVRQSKPLLKNLVGGDDRNFATGLKNFGSEDAARQTDCEAARLRVSGAIPIIREKIVSGVQKGWREKFQASEPLLVTFSNTEVMCSKARPSECWGVNGIYADGTPQWRRGNLTVLQDPSTEVGGDRMNESGPYGAVVARVCTNGYCGEPVLTGLEYAACPLNSVTTTHMMWTNRYTRIGPLSTKQDFNGTNDFTFEVTPDHPRAIMACMANPGKGFVPLSQ